MENAVTYDWDGPDSSIMINPRYSQEEKDKFEKILQAAADWPGHIWLSTSGFSAVKWVGLSKPAILSSAMAVNEHLNSNEKDKWIQILPDFHVGGMGIYARAYLSGASVLDYNQGNPGKWNAARFVDYIDHHQGTLTALVPTQLYDLVHEELISPKSLRAVIIGGGRVDPELYQHAIRLGWKILPSYGLTECASQVATAEIGSWNKKEIPKLKILSHLKANNIEGKLAFSGESILSLYAILKDDSVQLWDPKIDGWFVSEDRGSYQDGYLEIQGRVDSIIKIGGENVDMDRLESTLHNIRLKAGFKEMMTLVAFPDERLGFVVHLVVEGKEKDVKPILEQFNNTVLPFERIRHYHFVDEIPRNHLGKIVRADLLKIVRDV